MAKMSIDEMADFLGKENREVRNLLRAFLRNPQRAATVRRGLAALCRKAGIDPDDTPAFLPPRPARLPEKGVLVGSAVGSGHPVRIPLSVFQRVSLVAGSPGKGKTTLVFDIARQLIEAGIKVWIFDFSGEYLPLAEVFGEDRLVCLSYKDIRVNPWEAQRDPEEHIENAKDMCWQSFFLRDGSSHELTELLREMYEKKGVFSGGKDFPSQEDFEEELNRLVADPTIKPGSRRAGWIESLTRLKGVFAYLKGFRAKTSSGLRRLFEKSVIIDVTDLGGAPLDFFSLFVVKFIEDERAETIAQEPEAVLIVEEAHHMFSYLKERRMSMEEPLLVRGVRSLRKRGIGWIIIDQAPAQLPAALLSCVDLTIVFGLGGPYNVRAVKDLTGISEERAMRLAELNIREAIVQSAEFGPAFQIETPPIVLPARLSREEVRARMEPVIRDIFPDEAETPTGEAEKKESDAEKRPSFPTWFTSKVRRVLESIATNPYYSVEERTQEVGLGLSAENGARNALMSYGLVECGGQFANRQKLYVLTAKGREWCTALGVHVYRYKSGIEHEACLQAVKRSLLLSSPRITSCKSFSVAGVQPDAVLGLPNGGRLVVQVSYSKNHRAEAQNLLELCNAEGIERVILCGKDITHRDAVRKAVKRESKGEIPKKLIFITAEQCLSNKVDWKTLISEFDV
jgi:DNA helicase HerA-like ATPase